MIEISSENQNFIEGLVTSGRFASREEAVNEAVRRLRSELEADRTAATRLSAEEWCEWFERWAASHRALSWEADDSRESIYAGRDE